jgi:hypothetical protein
MSKVPGCVKWAKVRRVVRVWYQRCGGENDLKVDKPSSIEPEVSM